jgi:hypothetical protein
MVNNTVSVIYTFTHELILLPMKILFCLWLFIFYEKLWTLRAAEGCKLSCSTSQTAMALLDCDMNTCASNQQTDSLWVPKSQHSIEIVELEGST